MKIRTTIASAALVLASLAVPAAAQAAPGGAAPTGATATGAQASPTSAAMASTAAADGKVYAWRDPYRGGGGCAWSGRSDNWQYDCGDMRNKASSLENRGYSDAVNFYYHPNQGGAWACLGRGDMWLDLSIGREIFSWGANLDGYRLKLDNAIASHRWVAGCP